MLPAILEHILYSHRPHVTIGVPDHTTSAAVVCALHSGVSRKRSTTDARVMCVPFGATPVKTIREAISAPAQSRAYPIKFFSPRSGNLKSQRIAFGTEARMRRYTRNIEGSI